MIRLLNVYSRNMDYRLAVLFLWQLFGPNEYGARPLMGSHENVRRAGKVPWNFDLISGRPAMRKPLNASAADER